MIVVGVEGEEGGGLVWVGSGEDVPNVPDIQGQLKLVADRVMPAFG